MSTLHKLLIFISLLIGVPAQAMDAENLNTGSVPTETIDTCQTCTEIFKLLKDLIADSEVQGKIKHVLDEVCERLGEYSPGVGKICKQMVDKNLPMVFSIFNQFLKPGEFCSVMGLCMVKENKFQSVMAKLQTVLESPDSEVKFDLQCKFCVYLIELLEGLLPKEKSEAAIAQMLEQVCRLVPVAYRNQCEAFIELYSKKLLEELLKKSSPHTICTILHLCTDLEMGITGTQMKGYLCATRSYRCRNLVTAVECGAVEYCQKYAWL